MNLSPGTSSLTRDEKILALSIMIEQLQAEKRIDDWMRANPSTVYYTTPDGRGRACVVTRDAVILVRATGASDDDARAQAFNIIFTNEAAAAD